MSDISASHVHDFTISRIIQLRTSNDVLLEGHFEAVLRCINYTTSQPSKSVSGAWSVSCFAAYFPMLVHGAMRDSILGILDGRSSL